jgi:hypothetical protein
VNPAAAAPPEDLAARLVGAELARRVPDPVDWLREIPAGDAGSSLERCLDVHVRARSAA